jgi:hypothetical protein
MFLNILFYSLYLTETQRNDYDIKKQLQNQANRYRRAIPYAQQTLRGSMWLPTCPLAICFVDASLSPPFRLPYGTFAEVLDG